MLHDDFVVQAESPPFQSLARLWPVIEPVSLWAHVYVQNVSGITQNRDVGQEACCDGRVSHACSCCGN